MKPSSTLDETISKVMQKVRASTEKSNQISYDTITKQQKANHGQMLFKLISNFADELDEPFDSNDRYDATTSLLDNIYENVDFSLDQIGKSKNDKLAYSITSIFRPQEAWKEHIDNSNLPFRPILTFKPNATEALEVSLRKDAKDQTTIKYGFGQGSGGNLSRDSAPHPYYHELQNLKILEYKGQTRETTPLDMSKTPCTWVDTEEKLIALSKKLDKESIFGIDLEGHTLRTYQGFICLIQISTRKEDFLIDPFNMRGKMQILNSSFTNPKIVKVMHGCENDIIWFQRDFGIYMVNLFDTGQAARVLEYPSFSFSYLLKRFCNIDVDKKYQTSDWRIRPIPQEMILYARQDTHYLLYIYDKMCLELGPKCPTVFKRSRDLCMSRYEKPFFVESAYLSLLNNSRVTLNTRQEMLLKNLFKWRDEVARREDESPAYVLPNHMMLTIVESLPKNITQMLSLCHPIPPLLKKEKEKVFSYIATREEVVAVKHEKKREFDQAPDKFYHSIGWTENAVGDEDDESSDEEEEEEVKPNIKVDKVRQVNTSSFFSDHDEIYDPRVQSIYDSFLKETSMLDYDKPSFEEPKGQLPIEEKVIEKKRQDLQEDSMQEIKSLNEIYSISQKNKGNKAKKILKQEIIKESAPQEQETVELIRPVDFMKKIGWISEDKKEKPNSSQNPYSFGVNVNVKKKGKK